jgi:hypothetical protein
MSSVYLHWSTWIVCIPIYKSQKCFKINSNHIYHVFLLIAPHKHQVNTNATKKMTESTNNKVQTDKASNSQFVFPFRPLSLVFDHINYFVDMPKVISLAHGLSTYCCINSSHFLNKSMFIFSLGDGEIWSNK